MMLLRKKPGRKEIRCRFLGVGDARLSSLDESGDAFFANTLQRPAFPDPEQKFCLLPKR
jgi:hypothetical protein